MKKFVLARSYLHDKTTGILRHNLFSLYSLERRWNNNKVDESCIPEGVYVVKRDTHGKWQWFAVQDVEGRTAIEMHQGNKAIHSNGCILFGCTVNHNYDISQSETAMIKLLEYNGNDDFILTIRAANKDDFQV
jgi:hypothetical protein